MSAELLRRATQLLRDRVAGLGDNVPVWTVEGFGPDGYTSMLYSLPGIQRFNGVDSERIPVHVGKDVDLAEYLAMMSPRVALALADWLEAAADNVAAFLEATGQAADIAADHAAATVARSILREEPTS